MLSSLDKIAEVLALPINASEKVEKIQYILDERNALIQELAAEQEERKSGSPYAWLPRMKARRIELGMPRSELARKVGVSHSYIGHLENGQRKPSEEVAYTIKQILGFM